MKSFLTPALFLWPVSTDQKFIEAQQFLYALEDLLLSFLQEKNLGCDWKGYWMPSHLTDNVFNTVNNWITRCSFSYSAKSVTENSRKNITADFSQV